VKIISFAGALRNDSVSKKLVREANRLLEQEYRLKAEYVDLRDYPFPVYDSDIENNSGIPSTIVELGARVGKANALIIASPEYNGGISSVLKTLVDWLSRLKPNPIAGKFLLLLSASPSGSGGIQGLWHTRVPFEALGVHVFPLMVAIPRAQAAFDGSGNLVDAKSSEKLQAAIRDFVKHVENHHPIPVS
jgi:chromate reductase